LPDDAEKRKFAINKKYKFVNIVFFGQETTGVSVVAQEIVKQL